MAFRWYWTAMVESLKVWGLIAVLVGAGFVVTYQFVAAPPPKAIRIATGDANGAYYAFAQLYRRRLATDGITLEVVQTAGSVENLERLRSGDVTLALVQGGTATAEDREQVRALGSLFLEPLWVFTGAHTDIQRLSDLRGARVAVGPVGSGTSVLATQVLSANGVTAANATLTHRGPEAGQLLAGRSIDALLLVAAPSAPSVQALLRHPAIELFEFGRAPAYARVFPALTSVVLHEGVLNLERNIPPSDTTGVAVAAMLAARRDLNPNLVPALLDTVTRVHRQGGVLEQTGQFPSVELADLPLNDNAAAYISEGPSFLYRWLPYGTAVRLDRLKLMILPFVALLIPMFRVAPSLYTWRVRSKIYRWYAQVREIDESIHTDPNGAAERLLVLEREVATVSVPLAYTGELYHLRLHIHLLQQRLEELSGRTKAEASFPHDQKRPVLRASRPS
jgi:TRAP transporter TAXI family solute receptor